MPHSSVELASAERADDWGAESSEHIARVVDQGPLLRAVSHIVRLRRQHGRSLVHTFHEP
jgi:hypothetical protein